MNNERRNRSLEGRFVDLVKSVGLKAFPPPSIRVEKPVKDKNGEWTKTCTTPDLGVGFGRDEDIRVMVEVTSSNGNTPHKRAQGRVVRKAGLGAKYVVVNSETIETCEKIADLRDQLRFLKNKLGLDKKY